MPPWTQSCLTCKYKTPRAGVYGVCAVFLWFSELFTDAHSTSIIYAYPTPLANRQPVAACVPLAPAVMSAAVVARPHG